MIFLDPLLLIGLDMQMHLHTYIEALASFLYCVARNIPGEIGHHNASLRLLAISSHAVKYAG